MVLSTAGPAVIAATDRQMVLSEVGDNRLVESSERDVRLPLL